MIAFVEHYPATLHPVTADGGPDDSRGPVEVFQLRPGDADRLAGWAEVTGYPGADGGVMLIDGGAVVAHVQLGQFLVRDVHGELRVESSAPALFSAYQPG